MVAAYLLDPISGKYSLKHLAKQFLGREMIKLMELIGKDAEYKYKIDSATVDGAFPCPKCGTLISPDDETEETYKIVETKVKNDELAELIKDRRSIRSWQDKPVLHILPHWNWRGSHCARAA
jgi:DNA polymerase I-like protein with 3'-5' exonuclease and polymerase domains